MKGHEIFHRLISFGLGQVQNPKTLIKYYREAFSEWQHQPYIISVTQPANESFLFLPRTHTIELRIKKIPQPGLNPTKKDKTLFCILVKFSVFCYFQLNFLIIFP
jgi:hypothetical protein